MVFHLVVPVGCARVGAADEVTRPGIGNRVAFGPAIVWGHRRLEAGTGDERAAVGVSAGEMVEGVELNGPIVGAAVEAIRRLEHNRLARDSAIAPPVVACAEGAGVAVFARRRDDR